MKTSARRFKTLRKSIAIPSLTAPFYGTVELTGMVALYEICFEQSWKVMKNQAMA